MADVVEGVGGADFLLGDGGALVVGLDGLEKLDGLPDAVHEARRQERASGYGEVVFGDLEVDGLQLFDDCAEALQGVEGGGHRGVDVTCRLT